ncbi:hypothetical protein [Nonomuraea salmonea]|uniref:hypothetical protein n=1 Tax=Nonomuraea salmonea TaxID=46181 RepID=UPI002FEC294B
MQRDRGGAVDRGVRAAGRAHRVRRGGPRSRSWRGATRSIEFTGINTLSFADIGSADRASASTLFSMTQQISVALGVAVAAIALQVAHGPAATPLTQSDFSLAFYVSGAIALAGALLMLLLRPDAGHEVTGHRPRRDARTNA